MIALQVGQAVSAAEERVPVELTPEELVDVRLIVSFVWSRTDHATRRDAETVSALRHAGTEAWDIIAGFAACPRPTTARVRAAVLEEITRRVKRARWGIE
ncbi:MAG: hypothetical protein OEW52_00175 [Thermoleophilia bacterium]|nr:hypothetical protein [Thermoleophilia bacterium]